jgi:hypothetical protein
MSRSQSKHARVNPSDPQAWAICDLCGRLYNHVDLRWNMEWAGVQLQNTYSLRCRECVDLPQEQLRTIILPPDPPPILNARVPNFAYEEQTVVILQYGASRNPPWGAGPQTIVCLQDGVTPCILQYLTSS